jgi:hypothetical protein
MIAKKVDHWAWKAGTGWKVGAGQGSLARGAEGGHMIAKKVWNTGPRGPALGGEGGCRARKFGQGH